MRIHHFFKTILVAIVAFSLSYFFYQRTDKFVGVFSPSFWLATVEHLSYQTFTKNVSLRDVDTVEINSPNTRVYVVNASQEGKIDFTTGHDQADFISVDKMGHKLTIIIQNQTEYNQSSLTLYLPKNIKNLMVNAKASDVYMENIHLDYLNIHTTSGNINLNKLDTNEVEIATYAGNVDMNGNNKKLQLKTVSGNINISTAYATPEYDIVTVSGNIILLVSPLVKAKMALQSVSGKVFLQQAPTASNQEQLGFIRVKSISGNILVH